MDSHHQVNQWNMQPNVASHREIWPITEIFYRAMVDFMERLGSLEED